MDKHEKNIIALAVCYKMIAARVIEGRAYNATNEFGNMYQNSEFGYDTISISDQRQIIKIAQDKIKQKTIYSEQISILK